MLLIRAMVIIAGVSCETVPKSDAMTFEKALEQATQEWMSMEGVVGVGETVLMGKPGIMVLTSSTKDKLTKIPETYHGFPVVITPTGPIDAQEGP